MSIPRLEELAWSATPMGELTLRRRHDPVLDTTVLEVRLGEEYLMSSAFTAAEIQLSELGLAELRPGVPRHVVVGGLGLGFTAVAALHHPDTASVLVIDALPAIIDWHRRGLVPGAGALIADPRVQLADGDFFALTRGPSGYDAEAPGRHFDAILLDVDHSPRHLLDPSHADLYEPAGYGRLARWLTDDGVFGLWSDDPPEDRVVQDLMQVFGAAEAHVVEFPNPYHGARSANTVYVAVGPLRPPEATRPRSVP